MAPSGVPQQVGISSHFCHRQFLLLPVRLLTNLTDLHVPFLCSTCPLPSCPDNGAAHRRCCGGTAGGCGALWSARRSTASKCWSPRRPPRVHRVATCAPTPSGQMRSTFTLPGTANVNLAGYMKAARTGGFRWTVLGGEPPSCQVRPTTALSALWVASCLYLLLSLCARVSCASVSCAPASLSSLCLTRWCLSALLSPVLVCPPHQCCEAVRGRGGAHAPQRPRRAGGEGHCSPHEPHPGSGSSTGTSPSTCTGRPRPHEQ